MLVGKRVAFVTAGYPGKRFIYERARELGVYVIVVDSLDSWARSVADDFIPLSLQSPQFVEECVSALKTRSIDGVCTFSELALEATASVAAALGLPGLPEISVALARNKHLTRKALSSVKSVLLSETADLSLAAATVGFPAVVKPVAGADSLGVRKVSDISELRKAFAEISAEMQTLVVHSGALSRGTGEGGRASDVISDHLLLEEYIEGPEVDVDVVMQQSQVQYLAISDNGPTVEPYFTETWAVGPSLLSEEGQQCLAHLAIESIKQLGFTDGLFHVEARLSRGQAKLIEVNCRMGGGPIWHMHRKLHGRDLVDDQLRIACALSVQSHGISASPDAACTGNFAETKANGGFAYITPTAPRSGRFQGPADFFAKFKEQPDVAMVFEYVKPGQAVQGPDHGQPEWIGELVVWRPEGAAAALERAVSLAQELVEEFVTFLI